MENTEAHRSINPSSADLLRKSAGWMKLMSIVMFIGSAFIALFGILFGSIGNTFREKMEEQMPMFGLISGIYIVVTIIAIIIAIVYGYMGYNVYTAANAVQQSSLGDINNSLQAYAKHFKTYLVFTVVIGAVGILLNLLGVFAIK